MTPLGRANLTTVALVAISTAALPLVTGYGTILLQFVLFGARRIVESLSSATWVDGHHGILWVVVLLVNLVAYGIPLFLSQLLLGRASERVRLTATILWAALYLGSLFILFPATDGP